MAKPPSMEELRAHQERKQHEEVKQDKQELTPLGKPDNVPHDVWLLIQENGRLATERLNEILRSPRFHRLRASDQAKLISLAQNRAYGAPQAPKEDKNKGRFVDLTADEMRTLSKKATLPEYRGVTDAEVVEERADNDKGSD